LHHGAQRLAVRELDAAQHVCKQRIVEAHRLTQRQQLQHRPPCRVAGCDEAPPLISELSERVVTTAPQLVYKVHSDPATQLIHVHPDTPDEARLHHSVQHGTHRRAVRVRDTTQHI
jgi:hypothetical protein